MESFRPSIVSWILYFQYSLGAKLLSSPQDLDGAYDNSSGGIGHPALLFSQWTAHCSPYTMDQEQYHYSRDCTVASSDGQEFLAANNDSKVFKIVRELNNNAVSDRIFVALAYLNASSNGAFLRCAAEQPASSSLAAPSMMSLKDGTQLFGDGVRVVINVSISIVATSNRTVSFVRIFNFSQSDAGVYQCVFYDTPSQGGEVVTTRRYKVDTGPVYLNDISPSVVTLSPPDPLVLQVEAGGEYYAGIQWSRTPIALNVSKCE
eukprot:Em0004g1286a